jgi:hypothetical protein
MPQKVLFGPIQGRWLRHHVKTKIENLIFKPPICMGSSIKVVKQKKCFLLKPKSFQEDHILGKKGPILVRKIVNFLSWVFAKL